MQVVTWLKIAGKRRQGYSSVKAGPVKASTRKPSVRDNEIVIRLDIEIPDEVFSEPVFEATIKMPDITKKIPDKIEIGKRMELDLSKHLGFKVKVDMGNNGQDAQA